MRFLSIGCSLLMITMCIILQQQGVEAKPFIFKFFVPQAPARTSSSASSSSSSSSSSPTISTGIDFTSILTSKLNLLTSLLRTGLSSGVSTGFNFGFNKFFPNILASPTRRPHTSTTTHAPDVVFEPESSTKPTIKSTTSTTLSITEESSTPGKSTESNNLSAPIENKENTGSDSNKINNDKKTENDGANAAAGGSSRTKEVTSTKVTTDKSQGNGYDYTTSRVINNGNKSNKNGNSGNNGYDYNTAEGTSNKFNGYGYSEPNSGYTYDSSNNNAMNENEISNEIVMISNQYLPPF